MIDRDLDAQSVDSLMKQIMKLNPQTYPHHERSHYLR